MGARGSLQTYPPQDRPLTTLKELRPFTFFTKHHMSQHSRPFWGFPQGAWTRRKAAADGNEAGSVKTAWVGAKGLRDGPGTEKGSEAWLARRGSSQEERTVNSLGWAERHGNRAGVADSLAWREGGKVGCRARVRTRHKVAANGS